MMRNMALLPVGRPAVVYIPKQLALPLVFASPDKQLSGQ